MDGDNVTQDAIDTAKAVEMASPGAPQEEVDRIKALMSAPDETAIQPIKVVFDPRQGLGIFVGGVLLEFACTNGPYFNGPGQPRFRVTNLEDFVKAIGKQLIVEGEDGSTLITRALDEAMLKAIEGGCDGVEVLAPLEPANDVDAGGPETVPG